MKTRTTISLVLASTFALASLAMAQDQSSATAAKKPETTKTTAHHTTSTTHHTKMSKDEVTALQNALAKSGDYKGKVDGVFGKGTEEAVRSYQKTNGLKVTGTVNAETLNKLGLPVPTASASMGSPGTAAAAPTKK